MYVLTADQRASRVNADAVPSALAVVTRHGVGVDATGALVGGEDVHRFL